MPLPRTGLKPFLTLHHFARRKQLHLRLKSCTPDNIRVLWKRADYKTFLEVLKYHDHEALTRKTSKDSLHLAERLQQLQSCSPALRAS